MIDTLKECIKDKKISYTPIWFMRQAGRYLPEFREIRKQNPNFINLCLTPNLVTDITLQPLDRFDLDAAIIFSDILMIPYGLGQKVEFKKGEGPILEDYDIIIYCDAWLRPIAKKDIWEKVIELCVNSESGLVQSPHPSHNCPYDEFNDILRQKKDSAENLIKSGLFFLISLNSGKYLPACLINQIGV